MSDTNELNRLWEEVEAQLPDGWSLHGLRCASTGLSPDQRSEEWIAVAVGPSGEERTSRAEEPETALRGLITA
jgi:hypothetical protein